MRPNLKIAFETVTLEEVRGVWNSWLGVKSVDIMGNTKSEGNTLALS